ncbi:MAG: hypothetical protein CMJ77_09090 [Planctomycetaceae bacterium]|nr:hypothetical protein [Planctomycetaceae bacterium]
MAEPICDNQRTHRAFQGEKSTPAGELRKNVDWHACLSIHARQAPPISLAIALPLMIHPC